MERFACDWPSCNLIIFVIGPCDIRYFLTVVSPLPQLCCPTNRPHRKSWQSWITKSVSHSLLEYRLKFMFRSWLTVSRLMDIALSWLGWSWCMQNNSRKNISSWYILHLLVTWDIIVGSTSVFHGSSKLLTIISAVLPLCGTNHYRTISTFSCSQSVQSPWSLCFNPLVFFPVPSQLGYYDTQEKTSSFL